MADKPAAERTEKPTPERLRKAREEGRVPQSAEVPSALIIGMLLTALAVMAPTLHRWFVCQVQQGLSCQHPGPASVHSFSALFRARAAQALMALLPFLLCGAAASVLASLVSSGWAFAPRAVRPKLERISPVQGLKNLFSARSAVRLVVSIAKLVVVLLICYWYLRGKLNRCLSLGQLSPEGALVAIAGLVFGLVLRVGVALLAIAGGDLLFQRWKYLRDLRMTRQEFREERRQHEPSPEVRGRIRAVQIELVKKRMLQEVPEADVVVTNPTHVAVALRYEAETMDAPQVVAKGGDLLAEKIKEIARTHDVPIVERPELARMLYETVEVGQSVPESLYLAVAELLAMIYRLRKKRVAANRKTTP